MNNQKVLVKELTGKVLVKNNKTPLLWWQKLISDTSIREAAKIFFVHRIILSIIASLFAWLILPNFPHPWAQDPSFLASDTDPFLRTLVAPWQRWDTEHFLQIAANGYNATDGNTAFAPLFPLLTGLLGRLMLGHYLLAGLIIANASYFGVLVYLHKLTRRLFDVATAQYVLQFLALFPTAFFLLAAYTDSLYLLLVISAFYYADRGKWWYAAGLVSLASITRIQGAVLFVPLLYLYCKQNNFQILKMEVAKKWTGVALIFSPVSLVLFYLYVYYIVGDHYFNQQLERVWGVRLVTPWESLFGGILKFSAEIDQPGFLYDILNLACILLFSWLAWKWWRHKLPEVFLIYMVVTLLTFLTRQRDDDLWMSMSRYVLALFPAFMLVAWRIKKPRNRMPLFLLGAFFQTLFLIIFLLWKWIA